jgi:hypothetical protein
MSKGVIHGARNTEDLNICEVRVDCDCGNSTLVDRSGGNVSRWHKVRVGPVSGRVRVFCDECKNEYLIEGGSTRVDIDVSRISTGDEENMDLSRDGEGSEEFSGLFSPDLFPEDPALNAYLDQLFGTAPVDPKKEDVELLAMLERACDVVSKSTVGRALQYNSIEKYNEIVAPLVAQVLAKMRR